MTTKKMLMYAGIGALTYYLLKRKKSAGTEIKSDEPGPLKKFTNKVAESFSKQPEEIADEIPARDLKPSF